MAKDLEEAARWFRLAAEQGYPDAEYSLGLAYSRGEGLPQDSARAVKWLHKAAEKGEATAMHPTGARAAQEGG